MYFSKLKWHTSCYIKGAHLWCHQWKKKDGYIFLFITWTNIINYFFNWRRNELSDRQGGQAKKISRVLRLLALLHFSNLSALFKKVPSITRNNEQFWTISFTRVRAIDLRFLDDLVFSLHRVNFKCKILYDYFL